ncbi:MULTISPECIES: MarR family winged helix-turn-helix transcriptional regulator [Thermomonospora]|uniref:DNA-binding MarR family transcriptional regulator n=1 Tax=Thermomonospora cellulosilytica TaxID=1411118 RepID=A0A7W3N5D4_9ACTN|nr:MULTISPECIES: MarR family transcriptional regulator [Thermomonospora]MBA9007821.1 DNA-binding MarR family transcriptional regulator [Thermomonospora cellulosilytica]
MERGRLAEELRQEMRRSTMFTVLLHHATASKAGLNVTDAQCLNILALDGPQTPGRLAHQMGITTGGAITAVIDRLEQSGYVKRTRDPGDRRRVIVEPVPDALARFSAYFDPVARAVRDRLAGLTDDQLEFLAAWVRGMNAAMPDVIAEIERLP